MSVFLAGYDNAGALTEVKSTVVDPSALEEEYFETYFSANLNSAITKIKAFAWIDGDLKPLSNSDEIN